MPVLPDFQAPVPVDTSAVQRGMEFGQSRMERAQRMRHADEIRGEQREQFEVLRPVMTARTQAELATAGAQIFNTKRQLDLQARVAEAFPAASEELQSILTSTAMREDGQPDFQSVYNNLAEFYARNQWMQTDKQGGEFLDSVKELMANQFTFQQTDAANRLKISLSDAALERAKTIAGMRGETQVAVAETRAGAARDVAKTNAQSRTEVAETNSPAGRIKQLNTQAVTLEQQALELEDTDPETAQALRTAADQMRQKAKKDSEPKSGASDSGIDDALLSGIGLTPEQIAKFRDGQGSGAAPIQPSPAAPSPSKTLPKKAYKIEGQNVIFDSSTPQKTLQSIQDALDDGLIDEATAREKLKALGFKAKSGK